MNWDKYDDVKIINALYGGERAAIWAKRTFELCGVGFLIVALLIVFK